MNILIKQRIRRGIAALVILLAGCLWLSGCGSEKDDLAEQIQAGADFLHALAVENFEAGWSERNPGYFGGGAKWADEYVARVDEDRFPDWASDDDDLCVYWERMLSYDAINRDRQPGEPNMYTFEGKAWGWILMKEEGVHVLELGLEFEGNPHVFVDAWMPPLQ